MSVEITYRCTGLALVPLGRFDNAFKAAFEAGEFYRMAEIEDRSMRSHNHFFAAVHNAWLNLPEHCAHKYPTSEHLRKWALIETGWHDNEAIVLKTHDDALILASYARRDEFAVAIVDDRVVSIYRAKSQNKKSMGGKNFQRSKQDVLEFLDDLIGVKRGTVAAEAGQAA